MMRPRAGTIFLTLRAGRWNDLRVVKATNRRPTSTPERSIVVKLNIEVASEAFLPLQPEVKIVVPTEMVEHPVHVSIQEPEVEPDGVRHETSG